jgi:hypothetical protein
VALLFTHHSQQGTPARMSEQAEAARALALNALRQKCRWPVVESEVNMERVQSRAIAGLVYWWTFYIPPGTADIWLETVAGQVGSTSRSLESTDDWHALARSARWRPSGSRDAIEGCAEAVQVSSPERSQHYGTSLMRQAGSALEPEPRRDASNPRGTFQWSAPQARQLPDSGWEVTFWMAEWGVYKYRCTVSGSSMVVVRAEKAPPWFMGSMRPGG